MNASDVAYKDTAARELDLRNAVSGTVLTDRDERLLAWLARWDQETTDALADLIARSRHALIGPVR